MRNIIREKLKPSDSKHENIILAVIIAALLLNASMLIRLRNRGGQPSSITGSQISSYDGFSSLEQGIYQDLENFISEISMTDAPLPEIKELEENLVPPFVKDITWEKRGSLNWEKLSGDPYTYYVGISNSSGSIGSFTVAVEKNDREKSKILFTREHLHRENIGKHVKEGFSAWKEVISYTGEDERKKF